MNPRIDQLQAYPFERLNALKAGISPGSGACHIALSIGEPRHPAPQFIIDALRDEDRLAAGLGGYPPTRGSESLRAAIAAWTTRRFNLRAGTLTVERNVLPVNGTREALFSFAQAVLSGTAPSTVVMPNPFYQIYEGAAVLAGARPYYVPCPETTGFLPDFDAVPASVWRDCELLYLCSPGNPTGAVIPMTMLKALIELGDRHDFVIAADECYSEIYFDESAPPPGLLQAAAELGRDDYRRCIVFHSLSKRSNLPGLRSGFVAGDAAILERYYQYRTYHGCAMAGHVQAVSEMAWSDNAHVEANRAQYREKFALITPVLADALPVTVPAGGFYFWPRAPMDDQVFARELFRQCNVTVLPGSYLGRAEHGVNPGQGRIRMALVASLAECMEAATRIAGFTATAKAR
jgi:N-succinyldiaminopimelate aminotransferase